MQLIKFSLNHFQFDMLGIYAGDGDDNSRNDNTNAEVVNYEDFFGAVKDHKWDTVVADVTGYN